MVVLTSDKFEVSKYENNIVELKRCTNKPLHTYYVCIDKDILDPKLDTVNFSKLIAFTAVYSHKYNDVESKLLAYQIALSGLKSQEESLNEKLLRLCKSIVSLDNLKQTINLNMAKIEDKEDDLSDPYDLDHYIPPIPLDTTESKD